MPIKSYISGTVEAAIALARRELGDDALLLSQRAMSSENSPFAKYEVVFRYEPADTPGELEDTADLETFLAARDVAPELRRHIRNSIKSSMASESEVRAAISSVLPTAAPDQNVRIRAFVGPSGSGKTLSLLKLAIRERARPVRILAIDSQRPGIHRQLQLLAAIAGVDCRVVAAPDLAASLTDDAHYLIDTPGFGRTFDSEADATAEAIAKIPGIETHLVVTATTRSADLAVTAERFRMFHPKRLLFTRFDEASTGGGIASLAYLSAIPVSWLGTGQSLTGDLVPADATIITAHVLSEGTADVPAYRAAAGAI